MRRENWILLALLFPGTCILLAQRAPGGPAVPSEFDAFYTLGPDSLPRNGVPRGQILGPYQLPSRAFPGVEHTYHVYVPAQYNGSRDVSLMVFNDGSVYLKEDGFYRACGAADCEKR